MADGMDNGFASGLAGMQSEQLQQQGSQLEQALAIANSIRQSREQEHQFQMSQWMMSDQNPQNVHARAQASYWQGLVSWRNQQERDNAMRYAEAEGDKAYNQGLPFDVAYARLAKMDPDTYGMKRKSAFSGFQMNNPAPQDGKQPKESDLLVGMTGPLASAASIQAPNVSLGSQPSPQMQSAPSQPTPQPNMPAGAFVGGPAGAAMQSMPQQPAAVPMASQMPLQQSPAPMTPMTPRLSQGGMLPMGQPAAPSQAMSIDQFGAMPMTSPFALQQAEAQRAKNEWYSKRGQAQMLMAQVKQDMEEPQKTIDAARAQMFQARANQSAQTVAEMKAGLGPWYDHMKAIEDRIGMQKPAYDALAQLRQIEAKIAPQRLANEQKRTGIYAQAVQNQTRQMISQNQGRAASILKYLSDQGDGLDDTAKKMQAMADTLHDQIMDKNSDLSVALASGDLLGTEGKIAQAKAAALQQELVSLRRRWQQYGVQAKNASEAAQQYKATAQNAQDSLQKMGFSFTSDGKGSGTPIRPPSTPKTPQDRVNAAAQSIGIP